MNSLFYFRVPPHFNCFLVGGGGGGGGGFVKPWNNGWDLAISPLHCKPLGYYYEWFDFIPKIGIQTLHSFPSTHTHIHLHAPTRYTHTHTHTHTVQIPHGNTLDLSWLHPLWLDKIIFTSVWRGLH